MLPKHLQHSHESCTGEDDGNVGLRSVVRSGPDHRSLLYGRRVTFTEPIEDLAEPFESMREDAEPFGLRVS